MGQRPQHRAPKRTDRSQLANGISVSRDSTRASHKATQANRASSSRKLGTWAALVMVGVIGGGIAPGLRVDESPGAARDEATWAPSVGVDAAGPNAVSRDRATDLDRRDPPLSRSARREKTPTTSQTPRWLARCRTASQESAAPNGQAPDAILCALPNGFRLRGDAAAAWARLNAAYLSKFEGQLCLTGGYRDLDTQRRLYASKPGLAARPGTSNHGWGVAVDVCGGVETFGTEEYLWMLQTAGQYGWENPAWARSGGSRPEPWHWEFSKGVS